jgi:hypothetical protein
MKQPLLRDIIVVGGSIMQITAEEIGGGGYVKKTCFIQRLYYDNP